MLRSEPQTGLAPAAGLRTSAALAATRLVTGDVEHLYIVQLAGNCQEIAPELRNKIGATLIWHYKNSHTDA